MQEKHISLMSLVERSGQSIDEFARGIGYSKKYILDIINGKRPITGNVNHKISTYLNLSADEQIQLHAQLIEERPDLFNPTAMEKLLLNKN